jgi:hypothetical protein
MVWTRRSRRSGGCGGIEHRALLVGRGVKLTGGSAYERILRVTDYVSGMTDRHASGMTDRHALATFRRLTGITIPGRLG